MLSEAVRWSVQRRYVAAAATLALLVAGGVAVRWLPVDALPDVSTVQVTVLTEAPGLSPTEVERTVTQPIELALNGLPRLTELRSASRPSLSAVTVIFDDKMDVWFARQLVTERLREAGADLPRFASNPSLAPVSTGLGEIYIFVLRSQTQDHSSTQLRTLLDWEVLPQLRSVPGVIEVNPMGGKLKEFQLVVSAQRLGALGLTLGQVRQALENAVASVGGGYLERGGETLLLRGQGMFRGEDDLGNIVVRGGTQGRVLVKQVAEVRVGSALRFGVTTRDGEDEVVTGTVMMLLGANSHEVTAAVKQKMEEVQRKLPPGVVIDTVYDRSDFVGRTLSTVLKNLIEGALVVLLVLTVLLGSLRGAIAVVIGIPASMSVALLAMHLFGVTGDLMSLGAIDFGFLVDGPIVVLEAVMAAMAGKVLSKERALEAMGRAASGVAQPVFYSVAIIMLVYLPLLTLEGVEGKMFRPMATVMASALFGALIYSVFLFPGVLAIAMPSGDEPRWLKPLRTRYEQLLPGALSARVPLLVAMGLLFVVMGWALMSRGADFLPRIEEGDAVVTIRRAPSIGLEEARRLDLETEKVLKRFPEVVTTLAFTGRAELAFDPVGLDNTDIFTRLKPESEWVTGKNLDELSEAFKTAIEREVPGTFVSVSQPIEDRTNELISGSRADVAVQIFGEDLDSLVQLSNALGAILKGIEGTGDVRVERLMGMPNLTVTPNRERLARYGVQVTDVFAALEAARVGTKVGVMYEGPRRFDVRMLMPPSEATPEALARLPVETTDGQLVMMGELASIEEKEGPATVRRENFSRTVRVEVNLRGRDLVSWVTEAKASVKEKLPLPSGYTMTWGGQFENFERAQKRLAVVVPLALGIIIGMLVLAFGQLRQALAVFTLVPLALIGGIAGLLLRDMNFSLSAAVGFIALAGVAVLNGVVMATEVRHQLEAGEPLHRAVIAGASHSLRAVLTTAAVAALGFLPMMLNTGAGSEVQQPLATVVVVGIFGATVLMLLVFPGILSLMLQEPSRLQTDPTTDIERKRTPHASV